MSDEPSPSSERSEPPRGERPLRGRGVAALMSLFVPGLGHAYLGRMRRGLTWAAAPFALTVVMATASVELGPRMAALFAAATLVMWFGAIGDVLAVDHAPERYPSGKRVALVALLLLIASRGNALFLRTAVLEAFKVPSSGMLPTLRVGDHFFAEKGIYRRRAPTRGEVVLFRYPEHPEQTLVQRVVGVGGDRIEVKAGRLFVNGWEVPRCEAGTWRYDSDGAEHEGPLYVEFLEAAAYLVLHDRSAPQSEDQGPFAVPESSFFLMGDNRENSHDSRMWFGGQGGSVAKDHILGRAAVVWLSEADGGRFGADLNDVAMPAGAQHGLIEACLAKRPPRDKTTPPRP